MPSVVVFPTPAPAKTPILCPTPIVVNAFMVLTPDQIFLIFFFFPWESSFLNLKVIFLTILRFWVLALCIMFPKGSNTLPKILLIHT
jgi:hypothetical protein